MDERREGCRRRSTTWGAAVPALEALACTRIVATVAALEATRWPTGSIVLRVAPDEVLIVRNGGADRAEPAGPSLIRAADPHAIIEEDAGWRGVWVRSDQALALVERACRWEPPRARPAFAQGALADLPVKIWFEQDRVLFIVAAPFAADLEARLR
jgi:hypothetical protein